MKLSKEEYRKRLDELGTRKDLIPGIYNYCDRWCERCTFTKRCGNYSLTEGFEDNENRDIDNKEFWENLKVIFEVTAEMITEHAIEMGVDLDNLDDVDVRDGITENELTELSKKYGFAVHDWFKKSGKDIKEQAKKLLLVSEDDVLQLNDAIEVIEWYSLFISAKIHRAFLDFGIDLEEELGEDYINDNLGSAKIAIISIDRSIAAFGFVLKQMPQHEDEVLQFLATLSKLKREMLVAFPRAMEFKRPGFDD